MVDMFISFLCVVAVALIYWNSQRMKRHRREPTMYKIAIATMLLTVLMIVNTVLLGMQVALHKLPSQGYDFVGDLVMNYGILLTVILLYWVALKVLRIFSNPVASTLFYLLHIMFLYVYVTFMVDEPICDGEGIACGYLSLRYGAFGIIGLFVLFFIVELASLVRSGKT